MINGKLATEPKAGVVPKFWKA